MNQQEKHIIEIEKAMRKKGLQETYAGNLDQEWMNRQIRSGMINHQDRIYGFKKLVLFDHYSWMIPDYFEKMKDTFVKRKYPSERRPDHIYSNPSSTVNLTFSYTEDTLAPAQLEQYFQNTYHSVRKYYGADAMISCEQVQVGNWSIGYFDFAVPGFDKKLYNLIFHFLGAGRVIRGTFNCPEEMIDLWKPLAIGIMSSVERMEKKL